MTRATFSKTMGVSMEHGKMEKVMGEFKRGKLHSGSKTGPRVKSRKQAIAIGMSGERMAKKMKVHKPNNSPYKMGIHPDCVSHTRGGT